MNDIRVICDGACAPGGSSGEEQVLNLSTVGPDANVRLQIDVFRTEFLRELPKRLDDLLRLAAFIYAADTRVARGTDRDVFGTKWSRPFRMSLPVWDLAFWTNPRVHEKLIATLQFLTGDTYEMAFVQRTESRRVEQGILQFKDMLGPLPSVDCVIMFSGGVDSLAAIVQAISEGRHPILISHRSAPVVDKRQKNLVELLRSRFSGWVFPHISMWVNRSHGRRAVEFSQRSRSFLFTSLGATVAGLLNIDDVRLCDNGVVSINLPQSGQNVGTLLSRSTHPRFIDLVQRLMRDVLERDGLLVQNKLIFKSKVEAMNIIAASGHPELLQETVSCGHIEGKTKLQPHCGVCSQCIDRRFASVGAGLEEHDLASRYEKDIFTDPLEEGIERTHAENYVRFAAKLESLENADQFFEDFPELFDCLPAEGDVDPFGQKLWSLFQRHQQTVNGVLEKKIQDHSRDIRRASLPSNCLLRIISSGEHGLDTRVRYVDRLRSLICKSLPAAFQTQPAINERQVQDVGESVFQAAQETLHRETPQIPFGVVTTKPDFSDAPKESSPLFVEFKYPKDRGRLNAIVTEMTSRVTIYTDQGAWILFVVFDPNRTISNDDQFIEPFTKHEGVWVGIAR